MARKAVLVAIALTGIFLAIYLFFGEQSQIVKAQGCSGQLSMEPTDPYTLGTHVILRGTSNCGTVRFEIKGNGRTWHKAEIGTNNQIETWKTEETGSGTFEVCFVARGEGGWEKAHRSCRTVYVEGSQAPPPGSQQGERVKCWVNAFNVTPGTVQVGQTVNLAAQGQCDGNMRAARFTIDGSGWGEHTTNTHNTGWSTSGYSAGNHQICYQVTAGDWGQAASSCVSVTLTQAPPPTPYVEQGPPADNGMPGQTEDSNPSMVDHPQGDPPPAQVAPPAQVPPPAHNSSNNGTSGSGSGSSGGSNVNSSNDSGGLARCNTNLRLQVGAIAVVSDATPDPLPLRSGPATSNAILVQIPVRQLITIIGGPVCSGKFVWWETQYGGRTGWAAEINGYGNHNLLPNGASLPSSSSGSSSSDSGTDSGSNSASASGQSGTLLPSNLTVGMRARVTYYPSDPNTLRDRPSPSGAWLRSMQPGTEFTIIEGPVVSTYRYWKVRLDDGTVGWTAEGDGRNKWLEASNQHGPSEESIGSTQNTGYNTVTVFSSYWSTEVELHVNTRTCAIINGAEIISSEIARFDAAIGQMTAARFLDRAEFERYFNVNDGQTETFRQIVENAVSQSTDCYSTYYLVGTMPMDTSGLGNVVFGYAMQKWPWIFEELIADGKQGENEESKHWYFDNPDDRKQRELGREIGNHGLATPSVIAQIASDIDLF